MSNDPKQAPMTIRPGDLCHMEVPVHDKARAKNFYGEVFGWSFTDVPGMDHDYTLFSTPGGGVGGGLFTPGEQAPDKVVNYLCVETIEKAAEAIEAFGGKTLSPKIEVPGQGWLMQVQDSEGNFIAIWQSK